MSFILSKCCQPSFVKKEIPFDHVFPFLCIWSYIHIPYSTLSSLMNDLDEIADLSILVNILKKNN